MIYQNIKNSLDTSDNNKFSKTVLPKIFGGNDLKNLFLIDGAAGTGKTDLLEYVLNKYSSSNLVAILKKFTTRKQRPEEIERKLPLDLLFVSHTEFEKHLHGAESFYFYQYGGEFYGFYKASVDEALDSNQNVFIIVRDRVTIMQIENDYPKINTIPVFIYSDNAQIKKRLKKDGYNHNAINFRLARQKLVLEDFLRHPDLYTEIIINNSIKRDFHRLIDMLLKKHFFELYDEEK